MADLLVVLYFVPTAAMLAVTFAILWRNRRRSRKAVTLAFAAVCGLTGLWLFGIAFRVLWQDWLASMPSGDMVLVLQTVSLVHSCLHAACLVLLVLAVVADRPAPGRAPDPGPAADFDDAPPGRRP